MREEDLLCLREVYSCTLLRVEYLRGALEQAISRQQVGRCVVCLKSLTTEFAQ